MDDRPRTVLVAAIRTSGDLASGDRDPRCSHHRYIADAESRLATFDQRTPVTRARARPVQNA